MARELARRDEVIIHLVAHAEGLLADIHREHALYDTSLLYTACREARFILDLDREEEVMHD